MALPDNNIAWPPAELAQVAPKQAEWSAWYDGSPESLRAVYQSQSSSANFMGPQDRPAQYRRGLVGAVARMWWGRPLGNTGGQERVDQLHVPIASDICQASADLLYAEPPLFALKDQPVQKTPDGEADIPLPNPTKEFLELLQDQAHGILAAGAEVGAALGGRYHRVTWDRSLDPTSCFLTTVDADMAWPEFRWERLVGVTFWKVIARSKAGAVVRHVERHELDSFGNGIVLHAVYEGKDYNLGRAVPLEDYPQTAAFAAPGVLDADGALAEGRTPGLMVEYIPNQKPNRSWRRDPIGRNLGRSDLDGIEGPMDALDEAYSSWMRDVRLGKARLLIPEYMLQSNKPGAGASFDIDREVYVPIRSAAPEDSDAAIVQNQFAIRVEEHKATVQELTEVILRSAGYSAQTFGEAEAGAAMTATEVTSRERRSYLTRDRKIRLEKPAVERLIRKMILTQIAVFNTPLDPAAEVVVQFGDAVQEAPLTLAQTALALDQARAASTAVKVALVHPDWDPDQVNAEVKAIQGEQPEPAPSPF